MARRTRREEDEARRGLRSGDNSHESIELDPSNSSSVGATKNSTRPSGIRGVLGVLPTPLLFILILSYEGNQVQKIRHTIYHTILKTTKSIFAPEN
jgi:hypothetical protein